MTEQVAGQDRYLSMTRTFDAPRALVFNAFLDPDQLAQWFGPVGVSCPRDQIEVDAREGGVYRIMMIVAESGQESPVNAVFTRIVEPDLIEARTLAEPQEGVSLDVTLTLQFAEEDGRTRLSLYQGPFPSKEWVSMTDEGWESSFTKLDRLLAG